MNNKDKDRSKRKETIKLGEALCNFEQVGNNYLYNFTEAKKIFLLRF